MLPDRSTLIGQKLMKNAEIQMRHWDDFQTMCIIFYEKIILCASNKFSGHFSLTRY